MPKGIFDAEGFFAALEDQRQSRDLTWKQVAEESEVSASTLTRMAQGRRPDVDSLAALLKWSGLSADEYIIDGDKNQPGLLSPVANIAAQFRRDKNLSPQGKKAIEATLKAMYQHFSSEKSE
ncbi:MAG: helix-turn-helix domain-containing protein [Planctomycetia bacterium]|nr:helix-turn-helix domain-containing protein [Planctomycetia bacterium]